MKNLELTKWLQLVWDALAEKDEVKRNDMLQNAAVFLKKGYQQLPVFRGYVIKEKSIA